MSRKKTQVPFIKGRYLHDIPVTTKLTKIQYDSLKNYCEKIQLNMSFLIRELIIDFLNSDYEL